MNTNLRIGVLMGGRSIEREVSFNSGRTICDHLDSNRYTVIPIFQSEDGKLYVLPWKFLHRGKISDFLHRLAQEAEIISWDALKHRVDFVYVALHGRYGEDGILQGTLEVLGIPYLGSKVFGSALGMDKVTQKAIMRTHGLDVPKDVVVLPHNLPTLTPHELQTHLEAQGLTYPLIVKPSHEGSSLGVAVVFSLDELIAAVHNAAHVNKQAPQAVLIEEKLEGMEFVCVALEKITHINGTRNHSWFTLPITEVTLESGTHFFDYEQKYMPGKSIKITPARCSHSAKEAIEKAVLTATRVLEFNTISRIDGFVTHDGRVVLIDPNAMTGMSPSTFLFHQAAEYGMSHTDLINYLIETELEAYGLSKEKQTMSNTSTSAHADKKIRVAVLFGGDSNEREVSLESGRNVCYKLSPHKYDVMPLFVNDAMELYHLNQKLLIKNTTRAIAQLVTHDMRIEWSSLPTIADFVFIGLHGGKGENGAVQGTLEMLDLPYNGPGVLASALCMDKVKTNNFLRSQGFDVPSSTLLSKEEWECVAPDQHAQFLESLLHSTHLALPLIIKPHNDGCSVMVGKATTMSELQAAINAFFTSNKTAVMLEELIVGIELTCGVLGNDDVIAFPPSMSVAQKGVLTMEEKFLPGAGENQTPAPLPEAALELVQNTLVAAFKAIGCVGYSRIDCFYQDAAHSKTGKERVVLLEFNTLPALTPATCLFHQAAELGIQPMDLIDRIVANGFARHRKALIVEDKSSVVQQKPECVQMSIG